MPRNLPPHELYSNKLSSLYLGYALFEPNPNGTYDMVRVGDVGYIEDGKFVKLFNAFHLANAHPANGGSKFPTDFKPIIENHREIDELESLDPGIRQSTHVRVVGGDLTVSGPTPSAVLVGTGLRLTCGSEGGATLITKYQATRHKAMSSRGMLKYMLDNHTSWLQLVRDLGRPVEMHDLVFVKECILTGDWATILWNDVSYDAEVSFSVNVPGTADGGISLWGKWERHTEVPSRRGPSRTEAPPEGWLPDFNQCIFLKGIRVVRREWYDRVVCGILELMAAGEPVGLEGSLLGSSLMSIGNRTYKMRTVGDIKSNPFRPIQNAYDILGLYILENSNADVAVMDDDDLFSLDMASASSLDEICDLLLKSQGLSVKTSHETGSDGVSKVGRINWENFNPATPDKSAVGALHDVIVLDEQFNRIQLSEESTVATSEIIPEWDIALGNGREGGNHNHDSEVRLIEQTPGYDRPLYPLNVESEPGAAHRKDSDMIPAMDSLDGSGLASDASEDARSIHQSTTWPGRLLEVDFNPSAPRPVLSVLDPLYVPIPKPALRPRRESMEELRGKLHHERSLHPSRFLRRPSGDLIGRLVYTRSDPPDWGRPLNFEQHAAITEGHLTAGSSHTSSGFDCNITDSETDISQTAVDSTQFETGDAAGNTKNSKSPIQGPRILRGFLSSWWG